MASRDELLDYYAPILGQLERMKWYPTGNGSAFCPAHDDLHSSLSVKIGKGGELLLRCFGGSGCTFASIAEALGRKQVEFFHHPEREADKRKPADKLVHCAEYIDLEGEVRYQALRFEPKRFSQRQPDPARPGEYLNHLNGVTRIPYRLPELMENPKRLAFILEGELKVEAVEALGFLATCNAGGAEAWPEDWAPYFHGRPVAILPDHDEKGWRHANHVARCLKDVAAPLRIVELPGLHLKDDVLDWIDRLKLPVASVRDMLQEAVLNSPLYDPGGDPQMKLNVLRLEIARAMAISSAV